MQILDKLEFKKEIKNPIEEMKNITLPVFLYGGGSYARDVLHYLKANDIKVSGIFVDVGGSILQDILDDYSLKEIGIDDINFPCYVVMGMANYLKGEHLKELNSNVKKVFYLSVIFYGDNDFFTKELIMSNYESYQQTYELLEDELSRECMIAYLNARINGDATYVFPCYRGEETYFKNSVYQVKSGENFLDIGAYTGDTIRLFTEMCNGNVGKIWAFEADRNLEQIIRKSIIEAGVSDKTELYITGLWSERTVLHFVHTDYNNEESTIDSVGKSSDIIMDVDTIDNILVNREKKVNLMKINFANAIEVIKGSEKIIREDKPKLAVVVGFYDRLISDIPQIVKKYNPNYKIYFRFNLPFPAKIVMYAI